MAKKRRKPERRRRNRSSPGKLPDRRAMEGVMQQLVAGLQGEAPQDTPLAQAQALMYQAFEHWQDMLRLNPNDNQGVRYTLAGFLLFLDRDDDLADLLEQYPDEGTAAWAYTKALLAFRQHGDTPAARQFLKEAKKTNKH